MHGFATLATVLLLAGSGNAVAAQRQSPRGEHERIVDVEAGDTEMNAAKARAIAELPDFYRHLARPGAGEEQFMIKFDILPGDGVEYVWAGNLDRSTRPMTGTLVSHPEATRDRAGDRVSIADDDVIDWIYFRNGVAQGAYTQRVLLDRMPPADAAELRANMGW
ncbi:MAG TPA: DUF2314 domain-containing protein [Allosphingosinicella sp.]|nr:DUF2314 domain-containing protein [Allosphingosinicella sp.]